MNQRLIVAKKVQGVIHIYPLLCMDCEGDIFEWVNSVQVQDARTEEYFNLGSYRCVHCGFIHNLDERTFTIEATDDTDSWFSFRKPRGRVRAKKNDPFNESVDSDPTPTSEVL